MSKKFYLFVSLVSLFFSTKACEVAQKENDKCTQNEAYMNAVSKEQITQILRVNPDDYQHLFDQSNVQERNFPEHYSFFHGQDGMYLILHALQNELVCLFENKSIKNFVYLRARNKFVKDPTPFLRGCINDTHPEMREALLSVNLSIPGVFMCADGRSAIQGESTLQYVGGSCIQLKSSYPSIIRAHLLEHDDRFKHETTFTNLIIAKILAVMQSLASTQSPEKGQLLLQIFVDKNKVDQTAYLALPYGLPYTEPIYDSELPKIWDSEKEVYEDPRIRAWDPNKKRYSLSAILHMYRNEPQKLASYMNRIQARIVLSKDLFGNPESGVKIFIHHFFDAIVVRRHLEQIAQIAQEIFDTKNQSPCESIPKKLMELTQALPCSPHVFILKTLKNALLENEINETDALCALKKTFGRSYPDTLSSIEFFPDELYVAGDMMTILAAKRGQQEVITNILQQFHNSEDSMVRKWGTWFQEQLKKEEINVSKS